MFLLDTNVVSELRRKGNAAVERWVEAQDRDSLYISVIVLFELSIGVQRMERRDPRQGTLLRQWLSSVASGFEGRILGIDVAVAQVAAGLHVPDPRPINDSLIAATAIVHGMTIATRNVSDFQGLPVSVLNPWLL